MSIKNYFTLFIIFTSLSILESKEYRYDYTYVSEIDGWIKIHLFPAKWNDARLRCQLEAGVLASPETPALASTLNSIAAERFPHGLYTGVHATFSQGDYFSVEGTPIARMSIEWAPNEPNNHEGKEECIILQGNGTAADVVCTDMYPYVCYRRGPVTLNECGSVDPEYRYDSRTGSCYKFHDVGKTWSRAFMTCAAEGAYLAIINSNLEATVLSELYATLSDDQIISRVKHAAHIGYLNWGDLNAWTTIHGQPLKAAGYSKFENKQPDSPDTTPCGGMFRNGQLDDFACDHTGPFFCEKTPDSLYVNTVTPR